MTNNMSEKARVRHTAVYSSTDRQTDRQSMNIWISKKR